MGRLAALRESGGTREIRTRLRVVAHPASIPAPPKESRGMLKKVLGAVAP